MNETKASHSQSRLLSNKTPKHQHSKQFVSLLDEITDQLTSLSLDKDAVSDEDKSLVLTRGIPDTYRSVVTALQEADRLDDYEHVTNSLINEETRQNEKKKENEAADTAYFTSHRGRGRGQVRSYNSEI